MNLETIKEKRAALSAALRSGEYKQGVGMLRDYDGAFCCLGVACVINGAEIIDLSDADYKGERVGGGDFIPRPLADELGFNRETQDQLVELNDGMRASFNSIADFIDSLPLPTEPTA